ncbi:MAG: NnrS family protein [Oligoflexia bacterium]|nr:NnrS family protein [Oligoflexia bacterium]
MKNLFNLGFRPFFLLGAIWACLQIFVWLLIYAQWIHFVPLSDLIAWHAHEMIFGFATAIIAGFILTASQNWSGLPGLKGAPLKILVFIWLLARVLAFFWIQLPFVFAFIDLTFYPLLCFYLLPFLWNKKQSKNKFFFLLFGILFLFNFLFHLNIIYSYSFPAKSVLLGALYLIIIIISLISGRVLPFFSNVVLPEKKIENNLWLDLASILGLSTFAVSALAFEFSMVTAGLAFTVAAIHFLRWFFWCPLRTIKIPILFILYFAYAWIPGALFLKGLAALGLIPASIATHAFTVGAVGIMIYGMITRVTLGHTGRKIQASNFTILGYVLISLAALIRVFLPLLLPNKYVSIVIVSGVLWFLAFGIFLFVYGPFLWSQRVDGKMG